MEIEGSLDILVIDSNSYDAELTARVLRNAVANPIRLAKDGPQAFSMIKNGCNGSAVPMIPQMVFLDAHLRMTDSLELARQLRAEPPTSHVPIIMLTSSEEEVEALRARLPEKCIAVAKPLDLERLADALLEIQAYWLLLDDHPARVSKTICVGAW